MVCFSNGRLYSYQGNNFKIKLAYVTNVAVMPGY